MPVRFWSLSQQQGLLAMTNSIRQREILKVKNFTSIHTHTHTQMTPCKLEKALGILPMAILNILSYCSYTRY